MQTFTLLQKASGSKPLWRVLLPILALFINLSNTYAQNSTSIVSSTVIINRNSGANETFNAKSNASPAFDGQYLGSYDINSLGKLVLKGGTVVTNETGTSRINSATLQYQIYDPNFTNILSQGTIPLSASGGVNNGTRTFTTSNATIDLVNLITSSGADTGYNIVVSYTTTYQVNGTGRIITGASDDNSGIGYAATYDITGTLVPAPTVVADNIQIAPDGAAANTYYFPNTGTDPQFPGANFISSTNAGGVSGAFDINNGQLRLNNVTVSTSEAGTNTITSVVLYYRTRTSASGGGAYQPITLTQSGNTNNGVRTFVIDPASALNTNAQPNLIATPAVTTTGNFNVDIYFQANGYNSTSGNTFSVTYPPTGYFSATFTVAGTPIATTIWTGAKNDNWFDATNWSDGVPMATSNALIRDLGAGNSVPYPNINSDIAVFTAGGALLYDNTGTGPAITRNLVMGGSSQASRSIARLVAGQLKVYGNFDNTYDSFIQRENTIMEFAGSDQIITGGSFVRVDISGGGTKRLIGVMNVSQALSFLTPNVYKSAVDSLATNRYTALNDNAGVLSTDITQPTTNLVALADRATINNNNGAQLNGETDASYVYGFVRTSRLGVAVGEKRTYGNLGMDLTFTGRNSPGNVEVTRNTVEAYSPLADNYGIRRIFGVRPSDPQTNTGGLVATMVFHYRDSETINLNGSNTRTYGSGSIPENRLTIFVSSNSGNTFSLIGRDGVVDEVNNTVTRTGVNTFATFTLGDTDHPLPVVLTAFTAARTNVNALLTWQTASEQNNKGFEVQVATDGVTFRTLTFVASHASNSVIASNYQYLDNEPGKSGVRYYRLHQIDLDGTDSYSPIRTVSFTGSDAVAMTLVASPNPFTDKLSFSFNGAAPSTGTAQVTLIDVAGRTVREQRIALSSGSMDLGDLSGLRAGLYVAKIALPDGSAKMVRIQKQ